MNGGVEQCGVRGVECGEVKRNRLTWGYGGRSTHTYLRHSGNFDEIVIVRNPVAFACHGEAVKVKTGHRELLPMRSDLGFVKAINATHTES